MTYTLQILPSARKSLARLDTHERERIVAKIDALLKQPRPRGTIKLEGDTNALYRIRIGVYRVLYRIRDRELFVIVVDVAHRREAYQRR